MDFLTGALPNVMFIAGLIAIGLALGIEFKIVEVKGDLSRHGRLSAFGVGLALIATSVVLYTRPATLQPGSGAPTSVPVTPAQMQASQAGQSEAAVTPTTAANVGSDEPMDTPVQPTPLPAPTVTPSDDPIGNFRTLLLAAIADGRVSRDGADMLKKLEELQDALAKGDQKRTGDRLRDLQNRLQDGVRKQTVDSTIAQAGTAMIAELATRYNVPLPPAKP